MELLLEKSKSTDPTIRREAIRGLSLGFASKDRARSAMVTGLADEDFSVRATSAFALGNLGKGKADKQVVDALVKRLSDDYTSVRVEAAAAIGRLEATGAVTSLITALEDDSRDVRRAALASLAGMDHPNAKAEVAKWKDHPDWRLREAARGGKR